MTTLKTRPLSATGFGAELLAVAGSTVKRIEELERNREALLQAIYEAQGLLLLRDLQGIEDEPEPLLRLSRLFGREVENYLETQMDSNAVHSSVPEILIVSNAPPVLRQPPAHPNPPRSSDGSLPVSFPHRRGWHTDQSYRRPPPDFSLFYAVVPVPQGQGQTLYANGIAAYEALSPAMQERLRGLNGIHVKPGSGRSEQEARAGKEAKSLEPHAQPQRQPLVRNHPVTGRPALYLCEAAQMDWFEGPIEGLSKGPDGEGAALVYELMTHLTQPQFVFVQEWLPGDLIVYDNRNMVHAATWFDAARYQRVMWRTTVSGNPGSEYAGAERSWLRRSS